MSSHFVGKRNIYQPYTDSSGVTLYGAAALSKRLSTREGRQDHFDTDKILNFIMNFPKSYENELDRYIKIVEETGVYPDKTINFDNIGVGYETRDTISGIVLHDPCMEFVIQDIKHSLAEGDKTVFRDNINYMRKTVNFMINGEFHNKPVVGVW